MGRHFGGGVVEQRQRAFGGRHAGIMQHERNPAAHVRAARRNWARAIRAQPAAVGSECLGHGGAALTRATTRAAERWQKRRRAAYRLSTNRGKPDCRNNGRPTPGTDSRSGRGRGRAEIAPAAAPVTPPTNAPPGLPVSAPPRSAPAAPPSAAPLGGVLLLRRLATGDRQGRRYGQRKEAVFIVWVSSASRDARAPTPDSPADGFRALTCWPNPERLSTMLRRMSSTADERRGSSRTPSGPPSPARARRSCAG